MNKKTIILLIILAIFMIGAIIVTALAQAGILSYPCVDAYKNYIINYLMIALCGAATIILILLYNQVFNTQYGSEWIYFVFMLYAIFVIFTMINVIGMVICIDPTNPSTIINIVAPAVTFVFVVFTLWANHWTHINNFNTLI